MHKDAEEIFFTGSTCRLGVEKTNYANIYWIWNANKIHTHAAIQLPFQLVQVLHVFWICKQLGCIEFSSFYNMFKKEKLFIHGIHIKLVRMTIASITEIAEQSIVKDQTKLQFWEQH